jgi:lycopene cyclase domain-containing protein
MEYTFFALASVALVLAYELLWLRSGVLSDARYWITMAICFGFMLLVNGWFTKLSAPIVIYDPDRILGWRVPWDIPVEDYLFGWSLLTAVLARWKALDGDRRSGAGRRSVPARQEAEP